MNELQAVGSRLEPAEAARLRENGRCLVLRVPGNPDSESMQRLLDAAIDAVFRVRPPLMVLDFAENRLIDSTVAESIESAARQSRILGTPVALCELRPALCAVLAELEQLLPAVQKFASLDQALDSVPRDRVSDWS